ncbi:MAG TPA: 50S ribosomal protein L25 [Patescibacteria group bacterium]|nr:50S ribosomal protein L25 [Patescibacteria group bacterium]
MERLTLSAMPREASTDPEDVRAESRIPAVIYGGTRKEATSLSTDRSETLKVLKQITPSTVLDIEIDGKKSMALVGEIQRHAITDEIVHMDFRQVEQGVPVKTKIGLEFVGESTAVKTLGGTLVINRDRIKVSAAPENLVSMVSVDLSTIEDFETSISIKDLELPEGIELLDEITASVAIVQKPKSKEEIAAEEAAEAAADAEAAPAVTGGEEGEEGETPADGEAAPAEGGEAKADAPAEENAK